MAEKAARKKRARADGQKGQAGTWPPVDKGLFPVVAVGASAGGLEAFEQFFKHLPSETNAAFVVISHLDPKHSSMMTELVSRFTSMAVREAADGLEVEPDHVYVITPNNDLSIFHGGLQVIPQEKSAGGRMPIDFFLRSLAEDRGDRAVAIILSGTGSDGTLGLRAVQGAGGTVFVQDPETAKYDGMPRSAIRTGLADYVLPVEGIARQLAVFLDRYRTGKALMPDEGMPHVMQKILMELRSRTGHDFSLYKKNTVVRRIRRRINLYNLEDPVAYLRYLQAHPEEVQQLFKELLINVTSFFREPEAFDVLKKTVLPELLAGKPADYTIRVWVPGCATGEEAYSVAMVIREYAEETRQDHRIQMFATDIDEASISQARTGFFPPNIALDVPAGRLARFFVKEEGGYRVRKEIREAIVFAAQNMAKDAPFTKLDLLTCRNVLIYMEPELQGRLINIFHYSLKAGGVLFLGSSETIGLATGLFSTVDRKWKFFRAKPTSGHVSKEHADVGLWSPDLLHSEHACAPVRLRPVNLEETARKALLSAFAPPAIIVNDKGDILYIHGDTARYLTPAPGEPALNIANMAREGLQFQMRSALLAAATNGQDLVYESVRVRTNGGTETIGLAVKVLPRTEGGEQLFMFTFHPLVEQHAAEVKEEGLAGKRDGGRVSEVEKELSYTRETLQATVEEAQAANEELRSANEELQSTNEELQSTNEELETSKEELQSVNEELTTVNSELQSKIDQLSHSESDLKNLLDSTDIATIFLDGGLRIKRFTASARRVINLIPGDVGRPIGDVTVRIEHAAMAENARDVLDSLRPFEAEVPAKEDRWFLMRIVPYRTVDNVIDGVVITFTDITGSKREARERAEFAENIVQTVREPLLVLDRELRVVMANKAFYALFRVGLTETEGRAIKDLGRREWDISVLEDLLKKVMKAGKVFEDFRVEADFPSIGRRAMLLNARKIKGAGDGSDPLILLAMEDVTEMTQKTEDSEKPANKD